MADSDWKGMTDEFYRRVRAAQECCHKLRMMSISDEERLMVDCIDKSFESTKEVLAFAGTIALNLSQVDRDRIDLKTRLDASCNEIGLLKERLERLEKK